MEERDHKSKSAWIEDQRRKYIFARRCGPVLDAMFPKPSWRDALKRSVSDLAIMIGTASVEVRRAVAAKAEFTNAHAWNKAVSAALEG